MVNHHAAQPRSAAPSVIQPPGPTCMAASAIGYTSGATGRAGQQAPLRRRRQRLLARPREASLLVARQRIAALETVHEARAVRLRSDPRLLEQVALAAGTAL